MPTYEYACDDCGDRIEVFQSFSDDPLTSHDRCGGPLKKVFHPSGVVFKGSGFYATDSRPGRSSGPSASADGESKASDGNGTASKESTSSSNGGPSTGSSKASTSKSTGSDD